MTAVCTTDFPPILALAISAGADLSCALGVGQAIADNRKIIGGKSGLHRAECQVTPGRREPTASAAESKPPKSTFAWNGKGERVR